MEFGVPSQRITRGKSNKQQVRKMSKGVGWYLLIICGCRHESSWQKLKTLVNRSATCVISILFWQTANERIWARSINRIDVYVNVEFDEEMSLLLNTASRLAVSSWSNSMFLHFYRLQSTGIIRWAICDEQYTACNDDDLPDLRMMNPDDWTYSCIFLAARLLPCRAYLLLQESIGL